MHRRARLLGMLVALPALVLLMGVDRGCVTQPVTDTIVTTSTVEIKGTINELNAAGTLVATHEGRARLRVNAGPFRPWANTVSKVWTSPDVPLNVGVNQITGATERGTGPSLVTGTVPAFLLERKTDLSDRGTQQVFFNWSASGIDDVLKNIARETLEPDPSAADLNTFAAQVKSQVQSFFQSAYSGTNVTITAAAGTDVHTVNFTTADNGLYGSSPGDYRNQTKQQTSTINLGTFRSTCRDRLLTDTPARATDSMNTRIVDVATFIGRTVAHEVAHSLGLTNDANLHGCEGSHNCEAYDDANPADRFNGGHYMMDPGPKSLLHARIGQANAMPPRNTKRPVFNRYNKSYLNIIH